MFFHIVLRSGLVIYTIIMAFILTGVFTVFPISGGNEFAILTYGTFDEVSEKVKAMKGHALKYKGIYVHEVYLSAGIACLSEYKDLTPEGLYHTADKLMYEDKSAFYRQKGHDRRQR